MHLIKTKTDSELEKQQKRPRAESRRRRAGRTVEKFQPPPPHTLMPLFTPTPTTTTPHSLLPLMWLGSLVRV